MNKQQQQQQGLEVGRWVRELGSNGYSINLGKNEGILEMNDGDKSSG